MLSELHRIYETCFALILASHNANILITLLNSFFNFANFIITIAIITSIIRFHRKSAVRDADKVHRIEEFKRIDFEKLSNISTQLNRIEDYVKTRYPEDEKEL